MVKIIVWNSLFRTYVTSTGALNREFHTIFLTISVQHSLLSFIPATSEFSPTSNPKHGRVPWKNGRVPCIDVFFYIIRKRNKMPSIHSYYSSAWVFCCGERNLPLFASVVTGERRTERDGEKTPKYVFQHLFFCSSVRLRECDGECLTCEVWHYKCWIVEDNLSLGRH